MRTIILSDCHIGSLESNYRDVNRFLARLECDEMILLGDFWDLWDMNPEELRERYDDTIILLRKLLDNGVKIRIILGNHDEDYLDDPVMPLSEIPVRMLDEIKLPGGRRIALCHGHEFDRTFKRWYRISRFLAWINATARKLFGLSAKTFSKKTCTDLEGKDYSSAVEKIHKKAKKAFKKMGYDGLIMGHTHSPTYETVRGPSIDFYNAGDWKWSNTYIDIVDGCIALKHFNEGKK